jgi:hypothetical protein
MLEDVEGWKFVVEDGVIVGRCRDEPGILRITSIWSNRLPHPVTHHECLMRAAALAGVVDPQPSDWQTSGAVTGPYGSAYFDRGADRVYVWYCCRAPGLIVGAYVCPIDVCRQTIGLRVQCHIMITTAVFDRRVWGGDDPLTKLLIALIGADEANDVAGEGHGLDGRG